MSEKAMTDPHYLAQQLHQLAAAVEQLDAPGASASLLKAGRGDRSRR